jgi:hypothetical protein
MRACAVPRPAWLLLALALVGCDATQEVLTAAEQSGGRRAAQVAGDVPIADVIDALFLGSGPLIPRNGATACPIPRVWTGFPRGTAVRVRIATAVPDEARVALERVVSQVASATHGAVRASSTPTPADDPLPGSDEVTVAVHPSPREAGCPSDRGCVLYGFRAPGVLAHARAVEAPGQAVQAFLRDAVGRGILGMCQIDATLIGGPGASLMSEVPSGQPNGAATALTDIDLAASRAVYGGPLDPGATRKDFLRVGLVNLHTGARARAAATR